MTKIPDINPQFEAQIPTMIEAVSQALIGSEHHLKSAQVVAGQYLDHLRFEIDKVSLAISKLEWESRVDRAESDALMERLSRLEQLRDSVPQDQATASLAFMERFREALKEIDEGLDPPEADIDPEPTPSVELAPT